MQNHSTPASTLIRPRLNDYYRIPLNQERIDFAIPFLDEDIPLFVDPFLLWKSPSMQDQTLHTGLINCLNHLVHLCSKGKESEVRDSLIRASECSEVGLGTSKTRAGHRIGESTANNLISVFKNVPHVSRNGFRHFEEIQFYTDNISKDRISDFSCNFLKSFLIDFTVDQCLKHGIPRAKVTIENIYDYRTNKFVSEEVEVPIHPVTKAPILLTPKRWLRFVPWIAYEDFFDNYYLPETKADEGSRTRISVVSYNRQNYGLLSRYLDEKERTQQDCKSDPLFSAIPVVSAKRKLATIKKLPTGKTDNSDKKYEDAVVQLLASLMYPDLDFAKAQSRTDSGTQIRDLIFYNNKSDAFLEELWTTYASRQLVFELKNVAAVEREHINQINRYLSNSFGSFGVLVTRHPLPSQMFKNTVDLWSGQRKCIVALTDEDLELMVDVYESKQRKPIEVLKKKYIEFTRACPS